MAHSRQGVEREGPVVFMGSADVKIDEKGRFVIPVKWRSDFEKGAAVTPSAEACLQVWPLADFESYVTERRAAGDGSLRLLLAQTHTETPDTAGRITLPRELRALVGLDKGARLNGNFERLELWDGDTWAAWSTQASQRLEPAADKPELVPS